MLNDLDLFKSNEGYRIIFIHCSSRMTYLTNDGNKSINGILKCLYLSMMRLISTFIFCFFLWFNAASQGMLDIGNQWIFELNTSIGPGVFTQSMEQLEVTRDTLINGINYRIVESTTDHPCQIFSHYEILREDGPHLYRYYPEAQTDIQFIDFEEMFNFEFLYNSGASGQTELAIALIDSFGVETTPDGTQINTQYLRIINNMSYDDETTYTIYEGIGFYPLGILFPDLGTGLCDVNQWVELRCFVSDQDTIHFKSLDCFESSVQSGTDSPTVVSEISLYPNPTNEFVHIPDYLEVMGVFDTKGKLQNFQFDNHILQCEKLAEGLYFVMLENLQTGALMRARFLKVK